MKENIKFLDMHLRSGGYTMLAYYAIWLFITLMSVGASIVISWPAMHLFYGTLFEIIF